MNKKKKKDCLMQSLSDTNQEKRNYFFSGWIENLGVVPLFLLCAFLFLPEAIFLFFLLFSVIHVLETIKSLLNQCPTQLRPTFYKHQLLPRVPYSVKALALSLCFFSSIAHSNQPENPTILLSKGEHKELSVQNLVRFSNGNPEVLGLTQIERSTKIILKGKSVGHSELALWTGPEAASIYQVYVLPKARHLKLYQIIKSFETLGLEAQILGLKISVQGEISNLADYLSYQRIVKKERSNLESQVVLAPSLRNEIISQVYRRFFQEFTDQIRCNVKAALIQCEYQESKTIPQKLIKSLEEEFEVEFIPLKGAETLQNYRVHLKLVQFEQLDGKELSLGMSQLNISLKELFKTDFNTILDQNRVILGQNKVKLSTLAQPETIIQSGKEAMIRIGSEIPYQSVSQLGTQTDWKFAGLEINLKIQRFGNFLQVDYETGFTRPEQGQLVSGNQERSTLVVPLNEAVNLFQVTFQTSGTQDQQIPLLGDIPILGRLFQSHNQQKNYKNITGVIYLEKLNF